MSTTSRQDEGAFGSVLALLVVGSFLALAARLTDGGPIEHILLDPVIEAVPELTVQPAPIPDAPQLLAERVLTRYTPPDRR